MPDSICRNFAPTCLRSTSSNERSRSFERITFFPRLCFVNDDGGTWAFDFEPNRGIFRQRLLFASVFGPSDGLHVDAEGGLWITDNDAVDVRRAGPDGIVRRLKRDRSRAGIGRACVGWPVARRLAACRAHRFAHETRPF
mgnify:CR=1 FL=1